MASVPRENDTDPYDVSMPNPVLELCAGCIYKLTRLAALLVKLEGAPPRKRAKPPKATRKRASGHPDAITGHPEPVGTLAEGGAGFVNDRMS